MRTDAAEVDASLAALAGSAVEVFGVEERDQVRACRRWPLCVRFIGAREALAEDLDRRGVNLPLLSGPRYRTSC
jgi:hypothetical protein